MKKLILAFLGIPLTLVAVTAQAYTYTVRFHNSTSTAVTMSPKAIPSNKGTYIACSENCTSLPPNGDVVYKISSENSMYTWGTFTALFVYGENSNICDSGIQGTKIEYRDVTPASKSSPILFYVNVGEGLPQGLQGNLSIDTRCAT